MFPGMEQETWNEVVGIMSKLIERIPWEAVIVEIKREIKMRKSVYPGLIRSHKMTQEEMDKRIACLNQCIELIEFEAADGATQMNLLE
jgi:hypothetical protein